MIYEGINPWWIERFLDRLDNEKISMHSFLLMRNGKLIFEKYYAPYERDTLHRMFSVTKSIVSLCISTLIDQGKLKLTDHIADYFPEFVKKDENGNVNPYIAAMTIDDMLKMESCHDKTTYKVMPDINWVESFFTVEPSHMPGTVFSYDTSSTHTLCALVEKLSGMEFTEYMMSSFGRTLGFAPDTYCLKDPYGASLGGSGLMMRPIDLLNLMYTLSCGGRFGDSQLFNEEYLKKATSKLVSTVGKQASAEESVGYGYQFWQIRNGGFAMYGMGGQLAVCIPEKNIVFVTTADAQGIQGGVQMIYQAFWQEIYNKIDVEDIDDCEVTEKDRQIISLEKGVAVAGSSFAKGAAFTFGPNPMGITKLSYELSEDCGKINYTNRDGECSIEFGMGCNRVGKFPVYNETYAASACLADENSLWVKVQLIGESIGVVWFELCLKDNTCTLMTRKIEETMYNEYQGMTTGQRI